MKPCSRRYLTLLLFIIFCGSAASYARVFMRKGSVSNSSAALKALSGKSIYEAQVSINGGRGNLTIFNFDKNMDDLLMDIKRTFDIKNFSPTGGTLATATITKENTVLRLIAMRPNRSEQCLVFKLEQTLSNSALTQDTPRRHLLKKIPDFPGSTPVFHMKDDNTYASIAISRTDAMVSEVNEYYIDHLTDSGWINALDPESLQTLPINPYGMNVYIKDNKICCVMASTTPSGETTITLLHKTQGMK